MQLFTLAGIPVFVSPWFLILLGFAFQWGDGDLRLSAVMLVAITSNLLVHEFGHALTARHFGLRPSVVLHGFGGYCSHDPAETDGQDALIVAAGPLAGFLLGGLSLLLFVLVPWGEEDAYLSTLCVTTCLVSVFLNVLNLVPAWPLDGGRLLRLALMKLLSPGLATQIAHGVALALLVAATIYAILIKAPIGAMIGAYLAWMNIEVLRGKRAGDRIRSQHRFAKGLLAAARSARKESNWRETARLCHQIRTELNLPANVLDEVWDHLAISTVHLGKHKEAIAYLRRARPTREIVDAWVHCLRELRDEEDTRTFLQSAAFAGLSQSQKQELEEQLAR